MSRFEQDKISFWNTEALVTGANTEKASDIWFLYKNPRLILLQVVKIIDISFKLLVSQKYVNFFSKMMKYIVLVTLTNSMEVRAVSVPHVKASVKSFGCILIVVYKTSEYWGRIAVNLR